MKDRILNVILALCLLVASPLVGWKLGEYGLVELPPSVVRAMDVVCPVGVLGCSGGGGGGGPTTNPVSVSQGGTGNANGDGLLATCTDSVGTDAYACSSTSTPACPASLAASEPVLFVAGTANTGAATFAYCGLTAKALVKTVGGISTTLADNDILAKQPVLVRYNATDDDWKMISAISNAPSGGSGITSGAATSGCSANSAIYTDASSLVACNASPVSIIGAGAGNGLLTIQKTSASSAAPFSAFTATGFVNAATGYQFATNTFSLADTSNTSNTRIGEFWLMNAQATNVSGNVSPGLFENRNNNFFGTTAGHGVVGKYLASSTVNTPTFGIGVTGTSYGSGVNGILIGVYGGALTFTANAATRGFGVFGEASQNSGKGAGVYATIDAGMVGSSTAGALPNPGISPTLTTLAALVADDNNISGADVAIFRHAGAAIPSTGATTMTRVDASGNLQCGNCVLTSATMTAENQGIATSAFSSYTWTNAQVVALGAGLVGDITVATLPAKTYIKNAYVVITGAASGPTTLTVSCGDAIGGTPFINYIVASDAKAAANTVYGDAVAERGTSIDTEFFYLPSYTATTLVTCHFIATVANLNTTTGSTGRVILETALLP